MDPTGSSVVGSRRGATIRDAWNGGEGRSAAVCSRGCESALEEAELHGLRRRRTGRSGERLLRLGRQRDRRLGGGPAAREPREVGVAAHPASPACRAQRPGDRADRGGRPPAERSCSCSCPCTLGDAERAAREELRREVAERRDHRRPHRARSGGTGAARRPRSRPAAGRGSRAAGTSGRSRRTRRRGASPIPASSPSSSFPAWPTNGTPCWSSWKPGASPTNIRSARGSPEPKTTCVRPCASRQRVQANVSSRYAASSWVRCAASVTAATRPAATAASAETRLRRDAVSGEHGELPAHVRGAAVRATGLLPAPDELLEMRLALHADVLVDRHLDLRP